jgi:cell division protein FtsB
MAVPHTNAARVAASRTPAPRPQSLLERLIHFTGWRKALTVAAALLVLALGYHVIFGQNGLTAYEQKRRDKRMLDTQLKALQHENAQLKGHVDRLQNDPSAIEHQAREELHYTRPGEVIYTLPAKPAPSPKHK